MSGVWGETILRSELPGNDTAGLTFPLLLNLNTGPVTSLSKKEKERGPGKMNRRFQGGKGCGRDVPPSRPASLTQHLTEGAKQIVKK